MTRDFWAQDMRQQLGQKPALELLADALKSARDAGHFYGCATQEDTIADLRGEVDELVQALEVEKTPIRIRNEVGDIIVVLLHICQVNGIDFDEAIAKFTERWLNRKALQEKQIADAGYTWRSVPPEKNQGFWVQAKKELKAQEEAH